MDKTTLMIKDREKFTEALSLFVKDTETMTVEVKQGYIKFAKMQRFNIGYWLCISRSVRVRDIETSISFFEKSIDNESKLCYTIMALESIGIIFIWIYLIDHE